MAEAPRAPAPHIAMLPSPGMGHLIPMVEFSKRLVRRHGFSVTFVVPGEGPPSNAQRSILDAVSPSIRSAFLPPVDLSDLPGDALIETRISVTMARSNPALRDLFRSIDGGVPSALVTDLFGTDAFDVAKEFGVSPYIFFPSTANVLSFFLHLPKLDDTVLGEYRDLTEPVKFPGCLPIPGNELLDPVQDRTNDAYKWVLHIVKRYKLADGILVNSFMELEPNAIKALREPEPNKPPVYPVGPLVKMGSEDNRVDGSECLRWLDDQPLGSVLYVSFGSGGTLTCDQMNELALGLEQSEQRFLWVVRSPSGVANSSYFSAESQTDPFVFLPPRFMDRTKNRGLVVPSWAPQAQVLSHASTGGFLTHCGWNSTLESVVNGVPLIAWPLYAEQKMNAIMLTDDTKVALRPNADEKGIIKRGEVAKVVKGLMEGEEGKRVRSRMKDLKEAASRVIAEGGSSARALDELAHKWKNHQNDLQSH